jgi:hypothetical protein
MKKTFYLLFIMFLLNGCAETFALLGTTAGGASTGRIAQTSVHSVASYGIKKQTGKTPISHIIAYAEKVNPKKNKEPCISFKEKTNSKICTIVKKQLSLTKAKIINRKRHDKSLNDSSQLMQSRIDKKSKIKYLD